MAENRILIVDDEDDLCEILQFNLEMEGYTADTANSAEEALKKDLTSYSLILLDVMMGEISGFRMVRMLKENPATASRGLSDPPCFPYTYLQTPSQTSPSGRRETHLRSCAITVSRHRTLPVDVPAKTDVLLY